MLVGVPWKINRNISEKKRKQVFHNFFFVPSLELHEEENFGWLFFILTLISTDNKRGQCQSWQWLYKVKCLFESYFAILPCKLWSLVSGLWCRVMKIRGKFGTKLDGAYYVCKMWLESDNNTVIASNKPQRIKKVNLSHDDKLTKWMTA